MDIQSIIAIASPILLTLAKAAGSAGFTWVIKKVLKHRKIIMSSILRARPIFTWLSFIAGVVLPTVGLVLFYLDKEPMTRQNVLVMVINASCTLLYLINRNDQEQTRMFGMHTESIQIVWTHIDGIWHRIGGQHPEDDNV